MIYIIAGAIIGIVYQPSVEIILAVLVGGLLVSAAS